MSNTPTDAERTHNEPARDTLNTDTMQWVSAVVAYPFVFESTGAALWNDTVVGTAIFLVASYNFVRLSRDRLASVAAASLTALLGLWALVSPAVIEMGSSELATTTAAGGLIVTVLSAYNAYANRKADTLERTRARA